ncbi:E3 ubiquitin-protein ligase CCNB1IP1-like [Lytechinus variegatus]|uniref:E3 ubiquitin-protein ligase CCNB1IP1-like n=1 Tax=Lytechinus variegatus TaxID=7654 RepID=UPI001BB1E404|nr:E3 ubiquitin-protein ligase CCNB1IP1-like [Lytechinus variegatus]
MVLAGQRPEIILEVCSRALAFWTYQIEQERTYQDYVSKKAKERNTQMEQYCEQLLNRTQTEVSSLKSQISALRREVEGTKKRYNDVYEKLVEKNRQHQKLQLMYDSLRRKSITVTNMDSMGEGNGATGQGGFGGGGGDFEMPISFVESRHSTFSPLSLITAAKTTLNLLTMNYDFHKINRNKILSMFKTFLHAN